MIEAMVDRDSDVRRLSTSSYQRDDATGWFEQLYAASADGDAIVPWNRGVSSPHLLSWPAIADGGLVAPRGTLLVVAAARPDNAPADGPPFPLTRAEIDACGVEGVHVGSVDQFVDDEGTARWFAVFVRASASDS